MYIDPKHPDFGRSKRILTIGFAIGFGLSAISNIGMNYVIRSAGVRSPYPSGSDLFAQAIGSGLVFSILSLVAYGIFRRIFRRE